MLTHVNVRVRSIKISQKAIYNLHNAHRRMFRHLLEFQNGLLT